MCLPCTSDTLAIPKAVICFHDTILPGAWRYPPPFSLRNYCFPVLRQTFYAARVVKHWCRFSREAVESSFLEIFKTCLDLVLNTAPAGLAPSKGPDWTISQKYLPASTTLQFCDLSFSLSPLMVSVNTLKAAALPQEAWPCSLSATALWSMLPPCSFDNLAHKKLHSLCFMKSKKGFQILKWKITRGLMFPNHLGHWLITAQALQNHVTAYFICSLKQSWPSAALVYTALEQVSVRWQISPAEYSSQTAATPQSTGWSEEQMGYFTTSLLREPVFRCSHCKLCSRCYMDKDETSLKDPHSYEHALEELGSQQQRASPCSLCAPGVSLSSKAALRASRCIFNGDAMLF